MSSRREESRRTQDDRPLEAEGSGSSTSSSSSDDPTTSSDASAGRRQRSGRSRSRSHHRDDRSQKDQKKRKKGSSKSERRRGRKDRGKSHASHDEDDDDSVLSSRSREERRRERKSGGKKEKKRSKEDRRERRKKDRKKDHEGGNRKSSRKRRRRHRHDQSDDDDDDNEQRVASGAFQQRNKHVFDSILRLLSSHPALATDLPVMLVRLAGGASFNLSQMTDVGARTGLEQVFETLEPFGVVQTADTLTGAAQWTWKPPDGSSTATGGRSHGHDLLLIRILRSLCNEMGLTMQAVRGFEAKQLKKSRPGSQSAESTTLASNGTGDTHKGGAESALASAERCVTNVLQDFEPAKLAGELAAVAEMLLRGERVSLQGVTDPILRGRLEALMIECGLQLQPMKAGDGEETKKSVPESKDASQLTGYAIPDKDRSAEAMCRAKLGLVLRLCHDTTAALGNNDASLSEDDDEEDGPAPRTAASARKGPALPPDLLKAQAARRTLELECAKAGVAPPVEGQREEWMLVPGKFDFLGSVQSVRSRTFENKRGAAAAGDDAKSQASLDPAVEAEIRRIMQAHEQARGPSLMEIHQQKKEEAERAAGTAKGSTSWKWNRDKDLDFGRSVDKNALDRVYGNASTDLKSKFQGGFG